jgi:hypothetical protein
MKIYVLILFFAATVLYAGDSNKDSLAKADTENKISTMQPTDNSDTLKPVDTEEVNGKSTEHAPATDQEIIVSQSDTSAIVAEALAVKSELLKTDNRQKSIGIKLTTLGGILIGSATVYSVFFVCDNSRYGIFLKKNLDGNIETSYYLNPAIVVWPIAIPLITIGIINIIKGGHKIAQNNIVIDDHFQILPFASYNPVIKSFVTGAVAKF